MSCILSRRHFMGFLGTTALGLALPRTLQGGRETKKRPNILFIALDDLNDWIQVLNPKAPIRAPNIE